jgi:uncharacterized glyoxalase superfamily protein PhnB
VTLVSWPPRDDNAGVADALRFPDVVPYLYYADATAALSFLVDAFGFTEHSALRDDDGVVWNAQVRVGSGLVMIGPGMSEFWTAAIATPGPATCRIHVLVDDVDAHCERSRAAGATIHTEPVDHGTVRIYLAVDPGHHEWIFARSLDGSY